jgi:hypothetical protein
MDLAPRRRMASRRCRPLGVQKPPPGATTAMTGSRKRRLTNNVGQPFVVSVGEIALKRRRLDPLDRQNREQGLMTAKRLIEGYDAAPSLLDSIRGLCVRSLWLF